MNKDSKDTTNSDSDSIWKPITDFNSPQSPLSPSSADEYMENLNKKRNSEDNSIEEIEENSEKGLSRRKLFTIGAIAVLSAIPLGLGTGYLYQKQETNKEASQKLANLKESYGRITPVNTKTQIFNGQKLENVNIEQKSLVGGKNNKSAEAAVFVFSNGKDNAKRIVDVYIDFDSQVSRDFILINQSTLKSMIENGLIELRVHPVSSGSALSIYSPEALAESFVTSPDASWDFMLSLLKLSAEVQANGDIEILPAIEEKVAENEIEKVSAESIQNGTFSSWIIEVGNDQKLKTGYYPPIIYINETIIDPDVIDFNNTDAIRRHILGFDVKG